MAALKFYTCSAELIFLEIIWTLYSTTYANSLFTVSSNGITKDLNNMLIYRTHSYTKMSSTKLFHSKYYQNIYNKTYWYCTKPYQTVPNNSKRHQINLNNPTKYSITRNRKIFINIAKLFFYRSRENLHWTVTFRYVRPHW